MQSLNEFNKFIGDKLGKERQLFHRSMAWMVQYSVNAALAKEEAVNVLMKTLEISREEAEKLVEEYSDKIASHLKMSCGTGGE